MGVRPKWTASGANLAFGFAIMLPLASIGVGGIVIPLRQGRAVWAARHQPLEAGAASRPSPLRTPAGKEDVAAWVGHIGRKEGKSKSFRAYCTIARVNGLVVGQHVLDGWDTPGTIALREVPAGDDLATLDLAPSTEGILPPEAAKAACASIAYPADSVYEEAAIPMGTRVEVSGCHHEDTLRPCRNGADLVTVRSARDRFVNARYVAIFSELFCIFFSALPLSYLAYVVAGERIMLARRKKQKKPAKTVGAA